MSNRNVLKIVAGVMLAASLPAGAQVLGGGLGGAVGGAVGGGLGQGIHGHGGLTGAGSLDAPDASVATGKVRDGAKQAGQRTRDKAKNTTDATRSRVQEAKGSASSAASADAALATQPGGGMLDGGASAGASKRAFGREASANGNAATTGAVSRDGIAGSSTGQANASVQKSAPAEGSSAQ